MNVETAVCFNRSLSPPLQNQGVDSQSSEPQRDTGRRGDDTETDRYKEMKKEKDSHTEIKSDAYREEFFFLLGLRVLQKTKPKRPKMQAFNFSKEERQPPLIESVTKTRLTCKK